MPYLHWTNQDTAMGAAKHSFGMKWSMFYHLPRFGTQPPPTPTEDVSWNQNPDLQLDIDNLKNEPTICTNPPNP